jgi:hypothetical protein
MWKRLARAALEFLGVFLLVGVALMGVAWLIVEATKVLK